MSMRTHMPMHALPMRAAVAVHRLLLALKRSVHMPQKLLGRVAYSSSSASWSAMLKYLSS